MIGYIIYVVLFDIACEVHDYLTKKEKKGMCSDFPDMLGGGMLGGGGGVSAYSMQ